jgi:Fe-S oxidoreductase
VVGAWFARPVMTRALPLLEPHQRSLELCVYCPKLCRAACPVSNVEASETLIPWGKMSTAYLNARGDLPLTEDHARTAWACSNCYACKERCDHGNEVATTLNVARAAYASKGLAPGAAQRVAKQFDKREAKQNKALTHLVAQSKVPTSSTGQPVLLGCGYTRALPEEALSALISVSKLEQRALSPWSKCCGLPLLQAGELERFQKHTSDLLKELPEGESLVVVDPGCAKALKTSWEQAVPGSGARVITLVERAMGHLGKMRTLPQEQRRPLRYHDPCQLGRGLGLYDQPRALLTRLMGQAPLEFDDRREHAVCSGGGGLLPSTMPETSQGMAQARIDENQACGGEEIVTACAQSLLRFRQQGAKASDLVSWLKLGLEHLQ